MTATESNQSPTMKFFVVVWLGLIVIAAIEVFLTYEHFPVGKLLALLLILAFIEAGLGLTYFMFLKYERRGLVWSLIPALIFVLFMMDHIWADAFRLARLQLPAP